MLEIRLLGQYSVLLDGRPLVIASRPARLLLAYILLNQTPHPREHLAELLWPDSTSENARSNLRHALWRLRTDLAECGCDSALLVITEQEIGLDATCPLWLDVAVLESPIAGSTPVDVIENQLCVYQGELLPGYYDSWILLERERLKAILALQMDTLLERLVRAEHWPAVIAWSERWIALDELPEAAYRYLMLAHGKLGDAGLAAQAYRRCQHVLAEEFDVVPSDATRSLAADLQRKAAVVAQSSRATFREPAGAAGTQIAGPQPEGKLTTASELSRQIGQVQQEQLRLRRDLWLALLLAGMAVAVDRWRNRRSR